MKTINNNDQAVRPAPGLTPTTESIVEQPAEKTLESEVNLNAPQLPLWERVLSYFKRGGAALKHRNYRLFFTGQLISLVGTWMQNLAQGWLILKLTNSVFDLGVVTALQFLPTMFLSLFGGVLADRLPKRKTLIVTQSSAMILAFILALLTSLNIVQIWHVYVLASLLGLVNAFDMPTRQAFVPEMVGKKDLMNAVALNSSVFNTARAVGPAVAGILIGLIGIAPAFWVNGLSYIAVITGLSMMRSEELHLGAARKQTGSIFKNLQEGLSYAVKTPMVIAVVVMVGIIGTFGINFNVWIPDLAKNHLGVGADGYGILMGMLGLGALITALVLAVKSGKPDFTNMLKAGVGFSLFSMAVALSPWYWFSLLMMVGVGVSMIFIMISCNTSIQLTTPDHLRGRVMSLYMLVFAGTTPIGSLFVGWLASLGGTPFSMAIGAGLSMLAVPLSWFVLRRQSRIANEANNVAVKEIA